MVENTHTPTPAKVSYWNIYIELLQIHKKDFFQKKNVSKPGTDGYFVKEDLEMATKHMKGDLTSHLWNVS